MKELEAFVGARQACTSTSECTRVGGHCPFGCAWPVATSAARAAQAKIVEIETRYKNAGGMSCDGMCEPTTVECVRGRCQAVTMFDRGSW